MPKETINEALLLLLWATLETWIAENEVTCPESLVQVDSINLALPDLVGYHEYEGD